MKVLVGTASWSDKSLVDCKKFYPKEAKTPEGRLRYYASRFPLVEVDTSYYAIPLPETAQAWADRTPANFIMDIKAFRLFTGHPAEPRVLPPDLREQLPATDKAKLYLKDLGQDLRQALWDRFKASLEPLRSAGKLGMVHFQFAPWVIRNRDGHALVRQCVEAMPGYTLSVEFRNKTWFDEAHVGSTLAFERELNVVHTVIDGPQGFSNSVPSIWESTHLQYSLVRLHGRNSETWNAKGLASAADRFKYEYSNEELIELAAKVERLAPETFTTHVIMNNCWEDQGQRNGLALMQIIADRRKALVPRLQLPPGHPEQIEEGRWVEQPA